MLTTKRVLVMADISKEGEEERKTRESLNPEEIVTFIRTQVAAKLLEMSSSKEIVTFEDLEFEVALHIIAGLVKSQLENALDKQARARVIVERLKASGLDLSRGEGQGRHEGMVPSVLSRAGTLPTEAPELWEARADRSEKPPAFITRVYGPWLGTGFTQADLKSCDAKLYMALHNWRRKHELPPGFDLPTKQESNDTKLAAFGIDPASPDALKATTRLLAVARRRGTKKQ